MKTAQGWRIKRRVYRQESPTARVGAQDACERLTRPPTEGGADGTSELGVHRVAPAYNRGARVGDPEEEGSAGARWGRTGGMGLNVGERIRYSKAWECRNGGAITVNLWRNRDGKTNKKKNG